ncbi:MAG: hypothetical protein ABH804_01700 [archaeon]
MKHSIARNIKNRNQLKSMVELGIGFEEYDSIARNIRRVSLIPLHKRIKILEDGNERISDETKLKIKNLLLDMAYDKRVYDLAEINYSKGPPKGEGLFITAIVDYFLRKIN